MPHSSGGGHGGGGFHGGGSFHSGHGSSSSSRVKTIRYSRAYFPGAYCLIYYDRLFRPHAFYSDSLDDQKRKPNWKVLIGYVALLLLPIIIAFAFSFHFPRMISDNYDNKIVIEDTADVLTDSEEQSLKNTFKAFFDKTGITPSFESVNGYYPDNLEDYAYSSYVHKFKDEKHWLIVYSKIDERNKWAFEGMQGNDTDSVLTTYQTDKFNKDLHKALSNTDITIYQAFDNTFTSFADEVMKPYFYMDKGMIAFVLIWAGIFGFLIFSQVMDNLRLKHIGESTVVLKEEPRLEKCPYCDSPYYAYSIDRCPKCGGIVDYPKKKEADPEYQDPEF